MGITSQEYRCHPRGHKDLGIICCNKCGSPARSNQHNRENYINTLNWFLQNRENTDYIVNSGQRQDEKWWFRFKKHNLTSEQFKLKLSNLLALGFKIPDFNDDKTVYLISEPSDNEQGSSIELTCSNPDCGHTILLSNDIEKFQAIKKYHNLIFVRDI